MAHDVFISYSSHDKSVADAICAALEGTDVRCWMAPRDILPGRDWPEAIMQAIAAAKIMVVVFSTHANASQQVLREVERAVNKNVVVIPFRIDDSAPTKSFEYFLGCPHWLDAMTPPLQAHIDRLGETVRSLMSHVKVSEPAESGVRTVKQRAVPVAPPRRPSSHRRLAIAGLAVFAIAAASSALRFGPAWLHVSEPVLAFNARDWILITDCENLTGEAVFDRSLAVALDVGISQSNYVNVYPRERVRTALQRMRRKPADAVDVALASEIAQRDNVRAVLGCSISKVGSAYALAARVIDPRTERVALIESADAAGRDGVLAALDQLAGRVRRRLGESMATMSAGNRPLPQATTSSLEALRMFAQSEWMDEKDETAAKQLLRQAIALDPDFAMAHAMLGYRLFLVAETAARQEGDAHIVKALSLADRLTTRERMLIQAAADDARGNRELAVDEYKSYLTQYPDDTRIWFRLGWTYMAGLQQYEAAADAFSRVIAIDPKDSSALVNLATCYKGLRQFDRAIATYQRAFALNPDDLLGMFVNGEYGAALMHAGRLDEAQAAFEKMAASPTPTARARALRSLAFLDMYRGRYHAAIGRLREAIAINRAGDAAVSVFRDRLIVVRALLALGATADARRELAEVHAAIAAQSFGPEWLQMLVKIDSRLGDVAEAQRVAARMPAVVGNAAVASMTNRNTAHDQGLVALAQAEIELARGRPAQAAALAADAAGRLGVSRVLDIMAVTAEATGRAEDAVAHYAELLHGVEFNNEAQQDWFEAHIALGRLYERAGRTADARALYERVAALWKDGDSDLVVLKQVHERLHAPAS